MGLFLRRIAVFVLTIGAILYLLLLLQPHIVRALPSDYSRHRVIVDVLNDVDSPLQVAIFGDSRTIFGLDAKTVSQHWPGHPLSYNLASVGQSTLEGMHFFSQLPSGTEVIIQCLSYDAFQKRPVVMNSKALNMRMNGYEIDSTSKAILTPVNPIFNDPILKVAYDSRSFFRNSLHNYIRTILDNETFGTNFHSLFFPHIYTRLRHPKYRAQLKNPANQCKQERVPVDGQLAEVLVRVNESLRQKNIHYVPILMPVNPDFCKIDSLDHQRYLAEIEQKIAPVTVIDLSQVLDSEDFYDKVHPNKIGAEKLSIIIAEQASQLLLQ
ncbi:MAG: hypothetical protein R2824_00110 [Saprospiraceae bacterium]|nr:hypothetical protein [Lewinella sp.]